MYGMPQRRLFEDSEYFYHNFCERITYLNEQCFIGRRGRCHFCFYNAYIHKRLCWLVASFRRRQQKKRWLKHPLHRYQRELGILSRPQRIYALYRDHVRINYDNI